MELKPCPFCGTDDYGVHLQKTDYVAVCLSRWKVICETCGAEASEFNSPERAAEAWNRRCGDENAVPVVRCKDCKHWGNESLYRDNRAVIAGCERQKTEIDGVTTTRLTGKNDFCSWSERRNDDG